jgi:CheY-like chemotaxis protein
MGLRVLVVEDHADSREALRALLEIWGHPTVAVGSGDEALALADCYRPEVAILDLSLPDVDGVKLGTMLATCFPERPFLIALSGMGGAANEPRTRLAGFDRFLLKPAVPDDLQRILDEVVAARAAG